MPASLTTLAARSNARSTARLELAEWQDIQSVLRESHQIWSSGLDKSTYYQYIWWQMHQPWSRKNYRYLVYKNDSDQILSSCKLYTLDIVSHHQHFKIAGIGAVYTPRPHRGQGHALAFLRAVRDFCSGAPEAYDGMLLYSDIGLELYEAVGFESLGACDFYIWLPESGADEAISPAWLPTFEHRAIDRLAVTAIELDMVPDMVRYYQRWQSNLPFAVARSEDYWHYKLARERFVSQRSRRTFARLEVICSKDSGFADGHAIIERTSEIMRVLEVFGYSENRDALWQRILSLAIDEKIGVIRGWEAAAPALRGVRFVERDYALPMLLSFGEPVAKWREPLPCPLFELDHF
ncbi:MAG: GNAT family N-acetyltransferase [Candidatus Obscuribacterales bacterium]